MGENRERSSPLIELAPELICVDGCGLIEIPRQQYNGNNSCFEFMVHGLYILPAIKCHTLDMTIYAYRLKQNKHLNTIVTNLYKLEVLYTSHSNDPRCISSLHCTPLKQPCSYVTPQGSLFGYLNYDKYTSIKI